MTSLSGTNFNNGAAVGPQGEGKESPSTFPKYPAYKNSGVEWLGVVPEHWSVRPLKWLVEQVTDKATTSEFQVGLENIEGWTGCFIETDTDFAGDGIAFRQEDILFGKLRPYLAKVWLADRQGQAVGDFFVLRPRAVNSGFLHKYILTPTVIEDLNASTIGAKMPRVGWEDMAALAVTLPPHKEQTQIARFLDHETARIDALLEEQQRLIELLKEKRQAVISHAVTKGLDPTVPMKDSGVEWLGEVPAHWIVKRVKHITLSFDQGWSPQCENQPVDDDKQPGVLKTGCVNGGVFKHHENKKLPDDLELISGLTVRAGDLLVSRANTRELVGSAAVPSISYPNLMIPDKIFRIRVKEKKANSRFMAFYLGCPFARREIELSATGASSSMLNISQSAIADMLFPCPPVLEQHKIVGHIVDETYRLLALAEDALRLKKLLQERRSALISAAVTGKIDVRNWQPPAGQYPAGDTRNRAEPEVV